MRERTPAVAASHLAGALVSAAALVLLLPGEIQGADPEPAPGCALLSPGADSATSASCFSCHQALQFTHPLDLDYAAAAARSPSAYVPAADVVRAGLLLPYGELRCVTCHDADSPWGARLVLPTGATATRYVLPTGRAFSADVPAAPGDAVEWTPLCRACHRIGMER